MTEPRTLLRNGLRVLAVTATLTALVPADQGQVLAAQSGPVRGSAATQPGPDSSLGFTVNSSVGTAHGPALTAPMPGSGGGYARVHSLGMVGVTAPDGRTLWQRSAGSLLTDWHVTFPALRTTADPAPQVPGVTNPLRPTVAQLLAAVGNEGAANVHPIATGYLAGVQTPVVAVAETLGMQLGGSARSPFHVPGSGLQYGTFVTVLNGRTGQTMYYQLDPGYVTQLAIADGRLVLADETGYPLSPLLPMGAWRSVTTVRALSDQGNLLSRSAAADPATLWSAVMRGQRCRLVLRRAVWP